MRGFHRAGDPCGAVLLRPLPRLRFTGAGVMCIGKGGGMAKTLDKPSLYDSDFVAWLEEQAAHLRAGRLSALDIANLAEELEGLARSDRHELANRLETLILHLLKWDHQPDQRSNRWRASVAEQRRRIRRLLNESPSLRPSLDGVSRKVYSDAIEQAAIETQISESAFPPTLPYTLEQIFTRELPAGELPKQPSRKKHP
jgi:Domain of unknown function DUF29